jgi:hypothetical protein
MWSKSGDRDLDLELTRGLLFIPSTQFLTSLTGTDPLFSFSQANVLVSSLVLTLFFWKIGQGG